MRTVGVAMNGARLWVTWMALHSLLLEISCANHHHRRSMPSPTTLPVSKGGWRPVINSGLPGYGAFVAAPLHAPSYKISVPVADNYGASSSRPIATRDAAKLTSIAQSYRPTTHRTHPGTSPPLQPGNQPINSYYNPFGQNNNGLSHYKIIQNFPNENVVIRNPHNPYAARPVFKYQTKYKQPFHNSVYQQNNIPLQFAIPPGYSQPQQSNQKAYDNAGKPLDHYARPTESAKRPSTTSGTEIFKPEVYKLSDSDTSPQSVSQVKTAQQQQGGAPNQKPAVNQYAQYTEKFAALPPSILGTFSSFGVQSVKGRDPYQQTKTTYLPPQPSKQTIFNSFSFAPYFKSTPGFFPNTTPKFQTTLNQVHYPTTNSDYKVSSQPTQAPKVLNSVKSDPNAASKPNFKPSPQDPFSKIHQAGDPNKNKASTYNPLQTTTAANNGYFVQNFDDRSPSQFSQNVHGQPLYNYDNTNKKQKFHDNIPSYNNQQPSASYPDQPKKKPHSEVTQNTVSSPATYEVTENNEQDETITHSLLNSWTAVTDNYDNKQQRPNSEEQVVKNEFLDSAYGRPSTAPPKELPEEYAIVTEGDKGYENYLSYDSHVETQSRRPLGDDFEPIQKHKLKDYYYKVSTPSHDEYTTHYKRKFKSTTEAPSSSAPAQDVTTLYNANKNDDLSVEALPTLPPNQHFKRPNAQEPVDKDKIKKRNKNRRRRPPLANLNRDKEDTSTRRYSSSTEFSHITESEEHASKQRVRVPKPKPQITTPTITTDLSTSALPTISPTSPTVVKKKHHRRPITTTTDKLELTSLSYKDFDINKESPIMKIATRPQTYKVTTVTYDYKTETPDYSHKQDEKDTPTSDIDVNTESLRNKPDPTKGFSFHKDVRPIEAELEPIKTTSDGSKKDINVEASEYATTTPRLENGSDGGKIRRKNKYDSNRPKFSVKDYRNRLSSTTTTTEKSTESAAPKIRFPQRRPFDNKFNNENSTDPERKKFIPKDPRHKSANSSDGESVSEKEIANSTRQPNRQRHHSTTESADSTQKISSRIRNGSRRPKPTEETAETSSPTTAHVKRPLRKKIKDSEIGESVQDVTVTETTMHYDQKDTTTSERTRSESAIMKIAKDDKKHQADHVDNLFEHSKRVSDLTLAASKDYNNPGLFKTVSPNSRRIPNYFTIATDDPILPIEAFFPQLNQKKES